MRHEGPRMAPDESRLGPGPQEPQGFLEQRRVELR